MNHSSMNPNVWRSLIAVALTIFAILNSRADFINYETRWGPHWLSQSVYFCCGLVIEYEEANKETWYTKPNRKPEMRWSDGFHRKVEIPAETGNQTVTFDLKLKTDLHFELKLSKPISQSDPKYNVSVPEGSHWIPTNMVIALETLSITNAMLGPTPISLKEVLPRQNGFLIRFAEEKKTVEVIIPDWYALVPQRPRPKTSFRFTETPPQK